MLRNMMDEAFKHTPVLLSENLVTIVVSVIVTLVTVSLAKLFGADSNWNDDSDEPTSPTYKGEKVRDMDVDRRIHHNAIIIIIHQIITHTIILVSSPHTTQHRRLVLNGKSYPF